jgi:hypothetical protein
MQADSIKLWFSYIIAATVIVGGGLMLFAIRLDPPESNSANLSLLVAGFIGGAIGFVFNRESATQATRAALTTTAAANAEASK